MKEGIKMPLEAWLPLLLALVLFTNLYLSAAVYVDAKRLNRPALQIPPPIWGLLAFTFPLIGFFIYWLMNHSSLRRRD